jgi:hypothetical protein
MTQKINAYDRQIKQLNQQKERFNLNENYTQDLDRLNQINTCMHEHKRQNNTTTDVLFNLYLK